MIYAEDFFFHLKKNKIKFFSGVPDSVLKNLVNFIDKEKKVKHYIAVNEGSAVSLGIGYHLATKKLPCIYLQNSGLGNAINPLISIAHTKIYSIPMLLVIGWRGSPNINDEPQHNVKGKITINLIKLLNIKYCILKSNSNFKKLNELIKYSIKFNKPVACLIEPGNLLTKNVDKNKYKIKNFERLDVLKEVLSKIKKNTKLISTTGYTSRELFYLRNKKSYHSKGKDFYMVGGMGHASAVALGIAMNKTKQEVLCLDGDGSILMHLGSMRTIGFNRKKNFKHIIFNNGTHESVGGQPTHALGIDFKKLSGSLGYKNYFSANNMISLKKKIKIFIKSIGPSLFEIKITEGTLKKLPRPKNFIEIKKNFFK